MSPFHSLSCSLTRSLRLSFLVQIQSSSPGPPLRIPLFLWCFFYASNSLMLSLSLSLSLTLLLSLSHSLALSLSLRHSCIGHKQNHLRLPQLRSAPPSIHYLVKFQVNRLLLLRCRDFERSEFANRCRCGPAATAVACAGPPDSQP